MRSTHGDRPKWFKRDKPTYRDLLARVERLQYERDHDDLTSLPNRRKFREDHLDYLIPGSVVFVMDLVDFKSVNDTYGHAAGDRFLRKVARHLKVLALEAGGLVCRLGGDEFAGILPPSSQEHLSEFLDDIGGHGVATVGICLVQKGWDLRECLSRADAVMYLTKSAKEEAHEQRRSNYQYGATLARAYPEALEEGHGVGGTGDSPDSVLASAPALRASGQRTDVGWATT